MRIHINGYYSTHSADVDYGVHPHAAYLKCGKLLYSDGRREKQGKVIEAYW